MIRSVVVIGPSGNGKSTLARELAQELGWAFIEGDRHHPARNIAKMARGEALTDEDRHPFLDSIARALVAESGAVAACSALKKSYRDRLEAIAQRPILFILPRVPRDELQRRMEEREDHFMPPSLLESQLAAFEEPDTGERCIEVDGTLPEGVLASQLAERVHRTVS